MHAVASEERSVFCCCTVFCSARQTKVGLLCSAAQRQAPGSLHAGGSQGLLPLQVQVPAGSGNYVPISQQWLLVRPGARGQQIYNVGLGKCLDICTDRAAASLCGHAGNVYLQASCDSF